MDHAVTDLLALRSDATSALLLVALRGDFSPFCCGQAVRLANELPELSRLGAEVVLVSTDPPAAQFAMNRTWRLPFRWVSDPTGERFAQLLDAWNPDERDGLFHPLVLFLAPDAQVWGGTAPVTSPTAATAPTSWTLSPGSSCRCGRCRRRGRPRASSRSRPTRRSAWRRSGPTSAAPVRHPCARRPHARRAGRRRGAGHLADGGVVRRSLEAPARRRRVRLRPRCAGPRRGAASPAWSPGSAPPGSRAGRRPGRSARP